MLPQTAPGEESDGELHRELAAIKYNVITQPSDSLCSGYDGASELSPASSVPFRYFERAPNGWAGMDQIDFDKFGILWECDTEYFVLAECSINGRMIVKGAWVRKMNAGLYLIWEWNESSVVRCSSANTYQLCMDQRPSKWTHHSTFMERIRLSVESGIKARMKGRQRPSREQVKEEVFNIIKTVVARYENERRRGRRVSKEQEAVMDKFFDFD